MCKTEAFLANMLLFAKNEDPSEQHKSFSWSKFEFLVKMRVLVSKIETFFDNNLNS